MALLFWTFDSCVHRYAYGEPEFEWIPSSFNELWMRAVICLLFVLFGWYAAISEDRRLESEVESEVERRMTNALTLALGEFLPICARCNSVRGRDDEWIRIETYIRDRTNTRFSHGVCPSCAAVLYPGLVSGSESDPRQ